MYKFIYNEEILNKWFRFMYDSWYGVDNPPRQDESIFFSLAARNKYLNDKSLDINLNRTFMFNRSIVRGVNFKTSYENFLIKLRKLESNDGSYKIKSKSDSTKLVDIPNECMIVYFNINPVNILNAFLELKDKIYKIEKELWKTTFNNKSSENCIRDISNLVYLAEISLGKSESNKRWFDIDVDIKDNNCKNEFYYQILSAIEYDYKYDNLYIVNSNSGVHIGFNVSILKEYKQSPEIVFENIKKLTFAILDKKYISEIKLNKNGIIPLPGTKQGNHLVEFCNSKYKKRGKNE